MILPKKSLQIQKTYEALFALEDLREIFRQSLPREFDKQSRGLQETLTRIKTIIGDLETGQGQFTQPAAKSAASSTSEPGKRSS